MQQKNTFVTAGAIKSFQKSSNGLLVEVENVFCKITLYSSSVVRVHYSFNKDFDKLSYAVVAQPDHVEFNLDDSDDAIRLTTSKLKVEVMKYPLRIRFLTLDDEVINEDERGLTTSWLGEEVTTFKTLQDNERFVGLGEKTGPLNKAGMYFTNWNTDAVDYGQESDPLYASIPFYMGFHHNLAYGLFFDNSHKSHFNFGASTDRFSSFGAVAGEMDYYFFHQHKLNDILRDYTWLTGRMPMPPKWALGYQQCRWSYYPDKEVLRIANTFREKQIPSDVIYLDIDYMQDYKLFTWHKGRFPDPKKLLKKLKDLNFHTVTIIDPGVKKEEGYSVYEAGLKNDVFLKYPDGEYYTAQVWPGWCHFPDFTSGDVRQWWGGFFRDLSKAGVEGFWNDMNEIASWGGGHTPDFLPVSWEGKGTFYREAKNVYGSLMSSATYQAALRNNPAGRPFVLTRAGFAGMQRFTALWAGDNQATEEHMLLGARMTSNIGVCGVAFSGADVGGFSGDASKDLFIRWMTVGALMPLFRGHSMINTKSAEPWCFGEDATEIIRKYIRFRYRLMPYIYSLFKEASGTGLPVMRPLLMEWPFEEYVYDEKFENQFLLGQNFLVAPVESHQKVAGVYLPEGEWYDLHSLSKHEGGRIAHVDSPLEKLPVFIRASAVIPMQKAVQSTSESAGDILFLHVFNGKEPSVFSFYEDDGVSFDFKKGVFYGRDILFNPEKQEITLREAEGSYQPSYKRVRIYFHGFDIESVLYENEHKPLQKDFRSLFTEETAVEAIQYVEIELHHEEIKLSY